jgi:hypothetical protein
MSININQDQMQIGPTQNQLMVGKKGPLFAFLLLDFTQTPEYDLDMQQVIATNQFDLCQTLFIDASLAGADFQVFIPASQQIIIAKAGTQGYYNVIAPNPIRMVFTCAGGMVRVHLTNVAIPGAVWPTT